MAKSRIFDQIFDEICIFDKRKMAFSLQNSLEPTHRSWYCTVNAVHIVDSSASTLSIITLWSDVEIRLLIINMPYTWVICATKS